MSLLSSFVDNFVATNQSQGSPDLQGANENSSPWESTLSAAATAAVTTGLNVLTGDNVERAVTGQTTIGTTPGQARPATTTPAGQPLVTSPTGPNTATGQSYLPWLLGGAVLVVVLLLFRK
jgi:hypothetical protein